MAVVNVKSTAVTNSDATPATLNRLGLAGGTVKRSIGTVETTATDDIASVYRICRVHSSWFIDTVKLYSDDIGTTTIANFGIHRTAADGGAVVDADHFAAAVSLKDGAVAGTEIQHQSGVYGVEDIEKPLWQALGLTADPGVWYDVTASLTAAADAAGTISLRVTYVDNN
jgi:hypothetical protein